MKLNRYRYLFYEVLKLIFVDLMSRMSIVKADMVLICLYLGVVIIIGCELADDYPWLWVVKSNLRRCHRPFLR